MRLRIQQYQKTLAEIDRPSAEDEITEQDEQLADQRVRELVSTGQMETGYYDLHLMDGNKEVDAIIGIA